MKPPSTRQARLPRLLSLPVLLTAFVGCGPEDPADSHSTLETADTAETAETADPDDGDGSVHTHGVPGYCDGYCARTIRGDLTVTGSELVTLEDPRCVTAVTGSVDIEYNDALVSLTGLERLRRIGGSLAVKSDPALSWTG